VTPFVADKIVRAVLHHTKEGELPVRLCNYVDVYKNDRITERRTPISFQDSESLVISTSSCSSRNR